MQQLMDEPTARVPCGRVATDIGPGLKSGARSDNPRTTQICAIIPTRAITCRRRAGVRI